MATAEETIKRSRTPEWIRRYPPLTAFVIALAITLLVLPSALTLPQSNPSTVLEYAPVPPEDDTPPQTGSLSTLGLGSSSSLTTGASKDIDPTSRATKAGKGERPITKKCVGKPLRQTEDPNAPPCVPFFEGDNGGETWQGVNADQITVLFYTSQSTRTDGEEAPVNEYCDVDKPANTDPGCLDDNTEARDHYAVRVTRAMSKYFNERYQTYGRHVHFHMYYSTASSASARRADASDNWKKLKPFAVIDNAFFGGFNDIYADAMSRRRVMVFGAFSAFANQYYANQAPMVWSFWPDVEHAVDMYVSYICQKIAPYPVRNSGPGIDHGQARRYGLLSTTDSDFSGLKLFAQMAKEGIENCPNKPNIVAEATYSRNQYQVDTGPTARAQAETNIGKFIDADVTTILWLGGYEAQHSLAARQSDYYPEWIFAGDTLNDGTSNGQNQQRDVWRYAWGISNFLREDKLADSPGRQAYREVEPSGSAQDENDAAALYRLYYSLFRAIQVAGPYLQPDTVDQGLHAITRYQSNNPAVAACFYDPSDYTCVKDAMEIWFDPDAPDPQGDPGERGCYRMVREGARFQAWNWQGGDGDVFTNRSDPCNTTETFTFLGLPTNPDQ